MNNASFPMLVQSFFADRLISQRGASPRTVESYRDAFRLLLVFASRRLGKPPEAFELRDLDAPLVLAFLDSLERQRGNVPRTRNARLAAVRSFMRHVILRAPEALPIAQRVLAIPMKRFAVPMMNFLSEAEMDALLAAADQRSWSGRRDRALLLTAYNTGARVSELIHLRASDVTLDRNGRIQLFGKGRKERAVPLWRSTRATLKVWIRDEHLSPDSVLFPNQKGEQLTRRGIEQRIRVLVGRASESCPTLLKKHVSPHTLRHTTAMHMLQSGVDLTVIALWLGHERPSTTHGYVQADLAMKARALAKVTSPRLRGQRFTPKPDLLAYLDGLSASCKTGLEKNPPETRALRRRAVDSKGSTGFPI